MRTEVLTWLKVEFRNHMFILDPSILPRTIRCSDGLMLEQVQLLLPKLYRMAVGAIAGRTRKMRLSELQVPGVFIASAPSATNPYNHLIILRSGPQHLLF